MNTLTILIQLPSQSVARPFNRASSIPEAAEMIAAWGERMYGDDLEIDESAINSERPVLTYPHKGEGFARVWIFSDIQD